jgi:hypothetical protein
MITRDSSPFYIKFYHNGTEKIINECLKFSSAFDGRKTFTHFRLPATTSETILKNMPWHKDLNINEQRISLFITPPGYYYTAHKDAMEMQAGINYAVMIKDNLCTTSWYHDTNLEDYKIDTRGGISRDIIDFKKENHVPDKTMIFQQGEVVLFNTNMFHDVDNSTSPNTRVILTLRSKDPENWSFEKYKKILFSEVY